VCPPFTALESVGRVLSGSSIRLGGQNLHPETQGAFTGEVSGAMLRALDCAYVIVGHSERRDGMGEDDAMVARKLRAAQRERLVRSVGVGERPGGRGGGKPADVLIRQVPAAYEGLGAAARDRVIAYEPVWAIGTGKVASPEQAAEAHEILRVTLDRVAGPGTG